MVEDYYEYNKKIIFWACTCLLSLRTILNCRGIVTIVLHCVRHSIASASALTLLSTQSFGRPGGVGFPGGLHAAWAAGDLG